MDNATHTLVTPKFMDDSESSPADPKFTDDMDTGSMDPNFMADMDTLWGLATLGYVLNMAPAEFHSVVPTPSALGSPFYDISS